MTDIADNVKRAASVATPYGSKHKRYLGANMPDGNLTELPATRKEALAAGLSHYFTGVPCRNGHIAKRFTSDKSCLLCRRQRTKEWFRSHKQQKRDYDREYNITHRKTKTELMKRWSRENPAKASIHLKNSYALRKATNSRGRISYEVLQKLLKAQSHKCPYCKVGIRKDYHLDHIVALSRGGTHELRNWQLLCPTCNISKGNRDAIDFAQKKGLLL